MAKIPWKDIDPCIRPVVRALNKIGVITSECCCGHGKGLASLFFHVPKLEINAKDRPFGAVVCDIVPLSSTLKIKGYDVGIRFNFPHKCKGGRQDDK